MKQNMVLQDSFLNKLQTSNTQVSIFLVNGIKLHGYIDSFDQYVVILRDAVTQMVYKHAISTIVPAKTVKLSDSEQSDTNEHT